MTTERLGGGFCCQPTMARPIFTPETLTEQHRQFGAAALEFVRNEVEPLAADIEKKKPGVMTGLMKKAADLGMLMVEVPEAYGGLGQDKVTSMLISEAFARNGSFAVTFGAHTGIGSLPIVYYGTPQQKEQYLPKLASGEFMGAYALTEPGSGSDALGAKTTATLTADGQHYVLNGTKQFITNAAWADLFIVFAQVNGKEFSAFLVERKCPGVSIGPEEQKLGIRGSSTCQVILDDVKIPAKNLLGDVGRGHKIAFNILNIGRWKLGIAAIGASKYALELGIKYGNERRQFKKAITTFGLIRSKLANAATLIYAGESMAYRLGGLIDEKTASLDSAAPDYYEKARDVIEEFTIESSILKVFGSEALWEIADEMVQLYGGYGYIEEYPIERVLRDARINRIFEGTNEINRLIIPATLFKDALKGDLPLMDYVGQVMGELADTTKLPKKQDGPLGLEIWATEMCRRAVIYATSYAGQKYMADLKEKQRLLGNLADCLTDVFGMDSVIARATQAASIVDKSKSEYQMHLAKLFCFDARPRVFQRLRRIAMMMAEGPELDALYDNLGKLDERYRVDFMGMQDAVAQRLIDDEKYVVN